MLPLYNIQNISVESNYTHTHTFAMSQTEHNASTTGSLRGEAKEPNGNFVIPLQHPKTLLEYI